LAVRNVFRDVWNAARGVAPQEPQRKVVTRQYASAKNDRLTSGWAPTNGSADGELVSSLRNLRSRSRQLVRDASYAKRARVTVVNNVIGSGIGMQAQVLTTRDELAERVNDDIEAVWLQWSEADSCHTGGRLSFKALERAAMGQVFDAGEAFIRIHRRPFGNSTIPLCLELIEAERIADDLFQTTGLVGGNAVRMGVEVDAFFRPVAYWIRERHPNETYRFGGQGSEKVERVPAEEIIHLALIDRWPQTRGEPWLHAAARRLNDMDGYSEAEIVRARAQASVPWAIETPEGVESFGELEADGSAVMDVEPGTAKRLNPGEKMNAPSPNSPNPALDPFMRYMLREVAAGVGVSYESISRDYSQSNYSSSRLALLEDRDLWRFYQSWFVCDFRTKIHREWLQAAVLSRAIRTIPVEQYALDPRKFEAVLFKPRGWSWVDPTKEVDAYMAAIKAGLTTVTDVVAQTANGQDIEDVVATRARELKLFEKEGLVFETSPEFYDKEESPPAPPPDPPDDAEDEDEPKQDPATSRVFSFRRQK
jgi:lambda family phage portal protein